MIPRNEKVVVIGGGLGGLSAAISLATEGFSVRLLEKNDKLGGKLNVLTKDGFTFDLGPSILTLPHLFRRLFEKAGRKMEDYVRIVELQPHWRNFFEDGTVMDLSSDMRVMEEELRKVSPEEARGFYAFLDYSRRLYELTDTGYFEKGLESFGELVRHYGLKRSLGFDAFRTLDAGVRRFVPAGKLADILNYFIKYVGSSPYDAPALLNLIPYAQFGFGLWYVEGGLYALARALQKLAEELGVTCTTGEEVTEIIQAGSRATGVRTQSGSVIAADIVVSNMEVVPAHERLLKTPPAVMARLKRFAPSCSGFVLHLGVRRQYPHLAHHNFFYSRDSKKHFRTIFHDHTLSQDPTIYLVAPTRTDPSQAPAGCDVIKILPHIPALDDKHPFSPADFQAYRERVLTKLERMGLTDLRKSIVCEDQWTPADIQARYYSNKGSIYGVLSDRWKNLGFKAPRRSSLCSNVYFVGGSVNPGGGMPMVVLSGQLVRDKILQDLSCGRSSS